MVEFRLRQTGCAGVDAEKPKRARKNLRSSSGSTHRNRGANDPSICFRSEPFDQTLYSGVGDQCYGTFVFEKN